MIDICCRQDSSVQVHGYVLYRNIFFFSQYTPKKIVRRKRVERKNLLTLNMAIEPKWSFLFHRKSVVLYLIWFFSLHSLRFQFMSSRLLLFIFSSWILQWSGDIDLSWNVSIHFNCYISHRIFRVFFLCSQCNEYSMSLSFCVFQIFIFIQILCIRKWMESHGIDENCMRLK